MFIVCGVKRLHDRNHPGTYLLFYLVPLIGQVWIFVELAFLSGKSGPNRFGADPMEMPMKMVEI